MSSTENETVSTTTEQKEATVSTQETEIELNDNVQDAELESGPVAKTPEPEPEAVAVTQLSTGPRARTRGTRLVKTEITKPVTTLNQITIDEVVERKHKYDLSKADGPLKEILEFLDRYEDAMANSEALQPLIGESYQKQLYKNYLRIFTLSVIERNVAMECLLWKFFRNEKRSFRVSNLSRFTRNGKWNIGELQMFMQLNNIFNLIKDPAERIARVRTIQLGATVKDFPGEKIQFTDGLINWASSLK